VTEVTSPGFTRSSLAFRRQLFSFVAAIAALPDVRAAVEANHDENRWWPTSVRDWRIRMAVAGWSSRVSYAMVGTYADVVAHADAIGWDALVTLDDEDLTRLVRPIGLPAARARYLRSLGCFVRESARAGVDLAGVTPDDLIASFAGQVSGAGYNTAQCAVLYARGYHCGVIPVDSGMVTKLAPLIGIALPAGPRACEHLRGLLQSAVAAEPDTYRDLAARLRYQVSIPPPAQPTWFAHLALIYFKRLYLNRPSSRLCPRRPACPALIECLCQPTGVT
jgi:hypothetical protein